MSRELRVSPADIDDGQKNYQWWYRQPGGEPIEFVDSYPCTAIYVAVCVLESEQPTWPGVYVSADKVNWQAFHLESSQIFNVVPTKMEE